MTATAAGDDLARFGGKGIGDNGRARETDCARRQVNELRRSRDGSAIPIGSCWICHEPELARERHLTLAAPHDRFFHFRPLVQPKGYVDNSDPNIPLACDP